MQTNCIAINIDQFIKENLAKVKKMLSQASFLHQYYEYSSYFYSLDSQVLKNLEFYMPIASQFTNKMCQRVASMYLCDKPDEFFIKNIEIYIKNNIPAKKVSENVLKGEPGKITYYTSDFDEEKIETPVLYSTNPEGSLKIAVLEKMNYDFYILSNYILVFNHTTNTIIISDSLNRDIYIFQKEKSRILADTIIIYTNILLRDILKDGWVFFHGAAISKDDKTFAFLGLSGKGKTTSILKLMISKGYKYVDNDVVLFRLNDGIIQVRWWNRAMCIGKGTLKTIPNIVNKVLPEKLHLADYIDKTDKYKFYLNQIEVKRFLSISNDINLQLSAIILPEFNKNNTGKIKKINNDDAFFKDNKLIECVELLSEKNIYWFNDNRVIPVEIYKKRVLELITCVQKQIACYHLHLGISNSWLDQIDNILKYERKSL